MKIRQTRIFGDIVTDPFKLILRNIKVLFPFSMLYIFLPVAIALGANSYLEVDTSTSTSLEIILTIIAGVTAFIGFLNTTTTAFSLTNSAQELGFENVDRQTLKKNFFKIYARNFTFTFSSMIIFAGIGGFFFLFVSNIPMIGAVIIFLAFILFLFYLGPLWFLANSIYLFQKDSSFTSSFSIARDYMMDHYVGTWGTFIVSGIIFIVLRISFVMPFSIIYMVLLYYTDILFDNDAILTIIALTQSTILAFTGTFLIQYFIISIFFKYFDLDEKEHGYNLLARIEEIGETTESYFENEGEY